MITLEETVLVPRTVADCYRYVADFSTIQQWDPGTYRAYKLTAGSPKVGTEFKVVIQTLGQYSSVQYRMLEMAENDYLLLSAKHKKFDSTERISFRASGPSETEICYRADFKFKGSAIIGAKLFSGALKRLGREAVEGLQQALTPEPIIGEVEQSDKLAENYLLSVAVDFNKFGYLKMPNKALSSYMDGKTVVITGATCGLGLAAACELSRLGAKLALVGRGVERMEQARQTIQEFSGCDNSKISLYQADLLTMDAVRKVAAELLAGESQIDVLINNAGALFKDRDETSEGHERAMAINLYCPWLLTEQLLPRLRQNHGRVINVTSAGMYTQPLKLNDMGYKKGRYQGPQAYARAKRGLVSVTDYWSKQAENDGVTFYSMHPGWAATPGVEKSLPKFNVVMGKRLRDAQMGADTMIWLASSPAVAKTNGLLWFDRQPRGTVTFRGTGVSKKKQQRLVEFLDETIGR